MQVETQKEKKPRFTKQDVITGAQKRWRTDIIKSGAAEQVMAHATKRRVDPALEFGDNGSAETLSMQIERFLREMREYKNPADYILTKEEQQYRRDKSDAIALVVSFNKALTTGASTQDLERIGRQQAAMRKMTVNGADVARCYLRLLSDLKMTVLNSGNRHTSDAIFTLKPGLPPFTTPVMLGLIGRAYTYFRPLAAEEKVSAAA